MPPKLKFTREEIILAALGYVRQNGAEALTARSLAEVLGASSKPIFGLFSGMDEVKQEVMLAAKKLYDSYISDAMQSTTMPPYKASGMAYIRFAKEERELFKLLFMRDRSDEQISENRMEIRPILNIIMKNLNISEDEAFMFHLEQWIYVHGIATMIATAYLNWDEEFISTALTDVYQGLKHRFTGGK